jgi:lipopolysaccharide/colanic/teichoic acid biosynthesis glycosyltransferase
LLIQNVNTEAQPLQVAKRLFFSRLRVQIVVVVLLQLLGIYLPLLLPFSETETRLATMWVPLFTTTVLWSSFAAAMGLVMIRQLTVYPGILRASHIIPCLLLAYGLVALMMFSLRIEYSRYVILASFVTVFVWLHFEQWMRGHDYLTLLALIPNGNQRKVTEIDSARWIVLANPTNQLLGVEGVVADLHSQMSHSWERFIARCVLAGIPVYDVKGMVESLTGRVDIERLSENSFGSLLPSNLYLRLQRALDIGLALLLLPVFSIVIFIAAICIKIESSGPIFYVQPRMGFRARIFNIYKLRSMNAAGAGAKKFTEDSDARVTRVGRIIRKYRIDEMPQIFNILKGEMSWIGPRPEALELADWYAAEIPFYIYRHAVRPGISGWAQVMQGNVAKIDAATVKLQFDFYYIKHFSPWLDLLIVVKTIQTVLTGFGSK